MILLYGRRRVGKTVLARHWADTAGLATIYFGAEQESAGIQRRKLYGKMLGVPTTQAPRFDAWADLWNAFVPLLTEQRKILILDEVTHLAESDPAFLSALQHAWDQHLKQSKVIVILENIHDRFPSRGLYAGGARIGEGKQDHAHRFTPTGSRPEQVWVSHPCMGA